MARPGVHPDDHLALRHVQLDALHRPGRRQPKTLPSLAAQKGRIYFYRPSTFGAAVQPDIKLNGERIGTARSHGFYFVDRNPGNYEVTAATETEKELTFVLEAGQERYVRLKIQMGILVGRIIPELVDRSEAEASARQSQEPSRHID